MAPDDIGLDGPPVEDSGIVSPSSPLDGIQPGEGYAPGQGVAGHAKDVSLEAVRSKAREAAQDTLSRARSRKAIGKMADGDDKNLAERVLSDKPKVKGFGKGDAIEAGKEVARRVAGDNETVQKAVDVADKAKRAKDTLDKAKKISDTAKAAKAARAAKAAKSTADAAKAVKTTADTAKAVKVAADVAKTAKVAADVATAATTTTATTAGAPVTLVVLGVVAVVVVVVMILFAVSMIILDLSGFGKEQGDQQVAKARAAVTINAVRKRDDGRYDVFENLPNTTMELDGHRIPMELTGSPVTQTGRQGIGKMSVEAHMPMPGGHIQGTVDPAHDFASGYEKGYSGLANASDLTPEEEMWYVVMRWEYVGPLTWHSSYKSDGGNIKGYGSADYAAQTWHFHRKVLVTNTKTGRMVICAVGDWGPGVSERIGGLSPETVYYLSNQEGAPDASGNIVKTANGYDPNTDYKFEWVVNQENYQLGPITGKQVAGNMSDVRKAMVAFAKRNIGVPYSQDFRHNPGYFDCSSFVFAAYRKKANNGDGNGIVDIYPAKMAPTAADEAWLFASKGILVSGTKASQSQMLPGDPIYSHSSAGDGNNRFREINHAMLYIGEGRMIHSSGPVAETTARISTGTYTTYYAPGAVETLLNKTTVSWNQ